MKLLVNIDVPDVVAARAFYIAAFGFTAGRSLGDDMCELLGAGVPIYLLQKQVGSPTPNATRTYERHWTPVHLDLAVDDLEAAINRAVLAGARKESDITSHAWGRMCLLADPFGHGVCLLDLTPGYDAIADR